MASKRLSECVVCGKKESFGDAKDVTQAKWKILAWALPSCDPICVCNNCEYVPPKGKKDK